MPLLEQLIEEIERNPEKGRKLAEKILELYRELFPLFQSKELTENVGILAEEQKRLREDFNREQKKIWQEIRDIK